MPHRVSVISFLFVLAATPAHAQLTDSPRSLAMGGIGSDPVGSSAVIRNPAGMARAATYAAEAQFFRDADKTNALAISVVDSKTQPTMAVGISYGYQFADGDLTNNGNDLRVAIAHPVIPDRLSVGAGLHYLSIDRGKDVPALEGFTLDAGFLFSVTQAFHIAGIGHNLLDMDEPSLPRRMGGGLSYTGALALALDVLADLDTHADGPKPVFNAGLEILLGGAVPIRLGYENDGAAETQWISGGLGFMTGGPANKGQFAISYRHNLDNNDRYVFGIGLTSFL